MVDKITDALNDRCKSIKRSKILLLGIAYKKNVDDMRESPAVKIMKILQEKGAEIAYADPYVPVFPNMREYYFDLSSIPITPETVATQDCLVVVTNHDVFDWALIKQHARLIVDTRGVYLQPAPNIVKA